jgi:hypothetical protein
MSSKSCSFTPSSLPHGQPSDDFTDRHCCSRVASFNAERALKYCWSQLERAGSAFAAQHVRSAVQLGPTASQYCDEYDVQPASLPCVVLLQHCADVV